MASCSNSIASRSTIAVVLLLIAVALQTEVAQGQSCAAQLGGLDVCRPFMVPGSSPPTPNAQCCGALQAVQQDCLCNTLRVANQLPSQCNLPAINCAAN